MPSLIDMLVQFALPPTADAATANAITTTANQAWNQSDFKPQVEAKIAEIQKKAASRVNDAIVKPVMEAVGPKNAALIGTLAALAQGKAQYSTRIPASVPIVGGSNLGLSQQPGSFIPNLNLNGSIDAKVPIFGGANVNLDVNPNNPSANVAFKWQF